MIKTKLLNLLRSVTRIKAFEQVLVSLTQGKSKKSFISKVPLNYTKYKKGSIRNATRNGINYELDISDYMEWVIYFGIEVEPREVLIDLAVKGDIILDVGSNVGEVAMRLSRKVQQKGLVYAFEPDPFIYRRLEKNLSLNELSNVSIHNVGFGDINSTKEMAPESVSNRGGNRIVSDGKGTSKVKIQTLDLFVEENGLDRVDMIKIDVEGYEMKVLQGAMKTISKHRPKLFIEVSDRSLRQQGSNGKELINFVSKKYRTLVNAETKKPIDLNSDYTNCFFDLIAYHED